MALVWWASRCGTRMKAMPLSIGIFEKNRWNASRPPADAPMPTIGQSSCGCGADPQPRRAASPQRPASCPALGLRPWIALLFLACGPWNPPLAARHSGIADWLPRRSSLPELLLFGNLRTWVRQAQARKTTCGFVARRRRPAARPRGGWGGARAGTYEHRHPRLASEPRHLQPGFMASGSRAEPPPTCSAGMKVVEWYAAKLART